jgi:hypothetical protein
MVGDILIGKLLSEFFADPADQVLEIKTFFRHYWNQSQLLPIGGQTLELYSIFKKDKTDDYQTRHRFLAIMTFLLASTKSTSPYIKGFQDNIWRSYLLKTGDAKKSVALFNDFRGITDEFKTIHNIILSKKSPVTMLNQDIRHINRHNSMAMFLSCHYIKKGKAARRALPVALGYAYESFDFHSHLKDGDTFKQAKENFATDTKRYRTGVKAGEQFCSLATSRNL